MSKTESQKDTIETLIEGIKPIEKKQRVMSLDLVKGLAIVLIMLAHIGSVWLDDEWRFVYGWVITYADFFGPGLFLLLSALSVVFTVQYKKGKVPERVIRNSIFMRALIIILMGLIYNIISLAMIGRSEPFPINLWGWNILTFIGFSQIFCYYSLKLKKPIRIVLGLVIILTSEYIREILYQGMLSKNMGLTFLHFIITSPVASLTLFPWVALCIISTIFGELLYTAMTTATEESYWTLFRQFMFWGAILLVIGIAVPLPTASGWAMGWQLETPATMSLREYPHLYLYVVLNNNPYYNYAGMQRFLIRGTSSNMFFVIGINLLVIAIALYIIDIKKNENHLTRILIFYGQCSLTLFLLHHIFLPLYIGQLNIVFFIFIAFAFIAFMGLFMWIWIKDYEGVGTAEYLMSQLGKKKK